MPRQKKWASEAERKAAYRAKATQTSRIDKIVAEDRVRQAECEHANAVEKLSSVGLGTIEVCPDCHKLLRPVVAHHDPKSPQLKLVWGR